MISLSPKLMEQVIKQAMKEDVSWKDITTNYLVPPNDISEAYIVVKEDAVVCGSEFARKVLKKMDPKILVHFIANDGDAVKKGQKIAHIVGKTRAILSGERVALNFLGYLSGIATLTNQFVKKVYPYKAKIMDTRKTTPSLRPLEKMAVRCGGGENHRFNLIEMVLIKDNHRIAHQKELSIDEAIHKIRRRTKKAITVEVDTIPQFKQAIHAHPDIILLDNMTVAQMKKIVKINKAQKKKALLEASGGITLRNIREIAKTGVDRISIGALTHSRKGIDYSMELEG
jgi:nicotinate-nucleotide pyrophosphorylase (carboxylating)